MLLLRFFRVRAFSAGNGAIFCAVGGLFCAVFFMAQFLQAGLGFDPLGAGLRMLPWTATLFFVAPVAGKLVDRVGERPFLARRAAAAGGRVRLDRPRRQCRDGLLDAGAAAGRRRGRDLDVLPGGAELGRLLGAAGGDRQGGRDQPRRCASSAASSGSRSASPPSPAAGGYASPADFADGFTAAISVAAGLSLHWRHCSARRCRRASASPTVPLAEAAGKG